MAAKIPTETIKVSEARRNWSELLNRVFRGQSRIIVEKSGIPVAGIVSAADLERLNELDAAAGDFNIIDEIREAFRHVPDDDLEREILKAATAARRARNR